MTFKVLFKFVLLTSREEIILSVIGQSMLSHIKQIHFKTLNIHLLKVRLAWRRATYVFYYYAC